MSVREYNMDAKKSGSAEVSQALQEQNTAQAGTWMSVWEQVLTAYQW